MGYQVDLVINGQQTLEMFSNNAYSLIILDAKVLKLVRKFELQKKIIKQIGCQ